jgi:hypothetical protein
LSTQPNLPGVTAESGKLSGTVKEHIHSVSFIAYPKLLFIWPIILAGLLFAMVPDSVISPPTLGWVYITISLIVILALGVDIDRNQAIFWFVLIGLFWFIGLWLKDAQNIPVLSWIVNWAKTLGVKYDRGLGLGLSVVLLIPYFLMLFFARINDRWRITHNEFEHYAFGRRDDSLGRGAKTIRSEYPDVLEMLLGAAGTLIVYNASGQQELRRIPHVLFLPWVRKRLNKVLETMAVSTHLEAQLDDEEG